MGVTFRNDMQDRAMVTRVVANGPADDAGIRRGDEVVAINGRDVKGFQDVIDEVAQARPNDKLDVSLRRNGRDINTSVNLMSATELARLAPPPAATTTRSYSYSTPTYSSDGYSNDGYYNNGYYNNGYYGPRYSTGYRGYNNGYGYGYGPGYGYGNGYGSGYGYGGYGGGYGGYYNRGAAAGANIGGAIGGGRGAAIGAAIGAGVR